MDWIKITGSKSITTGLHYIRWHLHYFGGKAGTWRYSRVVTSQLGKILVIFGLISLNSPTVQAWAGASLASSD